MRYSNWRRNIWLRAVAKAGCEGAGFHDLRRANASMMVASGVDLKTVQTRFGHSDPRLTLGVYADALDERDRDAADLLVSQSLLHVSLLHVSLLHVTAARVTAACHCCTARAIFARWMGTGRRLGSLITR